MAEGPTNNRLAEIKRLLARPASVMSNVRIDGTDEGSWIGRVTRALPDEAWPMFKGRPLMPLCQINCTELPLVPASIADLQLIAVFMIDEHAEGVPDEMPSGTKWVLRAYPKSAVLIPLAAPALVARTPVAINWKLIESDYPGWEDVPDEFRAELDHWYDQGCETAEDHKVGGWPHLIQGELAWGPNNIHPANPEYVFQLGPEPRSGIYWGDAGVAHFGRGTGNHRDQWAFTWSCH